MRSRLYALVYGKPYSKGFGKGYIMGAEFVLEQQGRGANVWIDVDSDGDKMIVAKDKNGVVCSA